MPICSVCLNLKPQSDFFFRDKRRGKLHSQCKSCQAERRKNYAKEHYRQYGEQYRQRALARKVVVRAELRILLTEFLSDKCCERCGITDIRVLDFDHIDPAEKKFTIARALANTMSWDNIMTEITKCQILCANCHRIRTAAQYNWYRVGG